MEMYEAVASVRMAVHKINVNPKVSGVDAERMNQYICALSHCVHSEGCDTLEGHNARIKVKNVLGAAVEDEIRKVRGQ